MRFARSMASVVVAMLLIAGCEGSYSPVAPDPNLALTGPFPVTLPAAGDNQADVEEFELCKVGSASTFNYTVLDNTSGGTTPGTISLANNECKVIAFKGGKGQVVSVTEVVPTGYRLSRVDVTIAISTGSTTTTVPGPTVTELISGTSTNTQLRGVLAKFFNVPATEGAIGDFVWSDLNGNGVQDAGEPGIPNQTVNLSGAATATTTTDANGAYHFTGLGAGTYQVTVSTPPGFTATPALQGGDTTKDSQDSPATVTLASYNSVDNTIDFGFIPNPAGAIGDFVWKDVNGNGVQDAGEPGIGGILVALSGPVTATATTNGFGKYLFTNLPAGNYTVTVPTPSGYTNSPTGNGTQATDNNGSPASVNLPTYNTTDLTIDFGFVPIPPPVLQVTKTPDGGSYTMGSSISYTIVVSNSGGSAATNVALSDQLPGNGGLTWVSSSPSQGSCSITNNLLACSLGTIPAGGSVSVSVSSDATTLASCTSQPNPAAVATADGGLSAQDAGSQSCTPPAAQLAIVKTPDNGTFAQNGQASFTIVVTNPGTGSPATNVQLNDQLPGNGGLVWASATTSQGTCAITSNLLGCSLGSIAAGGSVTVTVASTLTTPLAACTSQPNPAATATADGGLSAQDAGSLSCTPASARLAVAKTPDNGTFTQGSQVSFDIVVNNPGTGLAATNVQLSDLLPGNGGLVWATATSSQGTCSIASNLLGCSLGDIAAGGSVTVTVTSTATTPIAACTSQPNPAAIARADGGLSAQDAGSLSCTLAPAKLVVVKTPDNGTFTQNGPLSFDIIVSNSGSGAAATNVLLNDQLPGNGGLVWASATPTQGTCSITSNALACSLGTIAARGSVTVTVTSTSTTPLAACTSQPNPAAIATADGHLTAQDDGSQSCTPAPAQLAVVKTPDNGTFTQGSAVSYNIVVSNPGTGLSAMNVSLSDQLPGNGGLVWTITTATQGTCSVAANLLTCSLGDIAARASVTVTVSSGATPLAACTAQPNPAAIATANGGLTAQDAGSIGCTPPPPSGQIGDFVWKDVNGNGVQDAGEPGIGGLLVTLTGPVIATTTTNGFGAYLFANLPSGSYTVTVATPAGYTASPTGAGTTATDNNGSPAAVTLATSSDVNLTIDFGFVPIPQPTGQIGDYVWEDEDGNGIQGVSETGMAGITVTLSGPVSATTTTDQNGAYLFTNLPAGTYTVAVATPTGFTASPSNQGGNPLMDSNGSPATVTLPTSSSVNLSIDFGFVPPAGVGRMTGGGAQITASGLRISRGFTLHCDITLSNNLEVNWPGAGSGTNNFHITRPLTSARCILDPAYRQPPPRAPFNTFIGVAAGTLNGIPGATARFTFVDAGEPGSNDMVKMQIFDANNVLVLDIPFSNLDHGNMQAHYDQPHGSNWNKP